MAARTVQRFSQLVGALDRPADARRAAELAAEVVTVTNASSGSWKEADKSKLRELVAQLAGRLAALDRQLSDAELAAELLQHRTQLTVAFAALMAAAHIARRLDLPPSDVYRLVSCVALVLRAGRSTAATGPEGFILAAPRGDADYWRMQLGAVLDCLLLCACSPPGTAAAFASTTARPAALLAWLCHATPVFDWLASSTARPGVPKQVRISYELLVDELLTQDWFAKHREALQASPEQATVVAGFLLDHCLPAAADTAARQPVDGSSLEALARQLCSDHLAAGLALQFLRRASTAAGAEAVQHAATIVHSLPAVPEGEAPPEPVAQQYQAACLLLGTLCTVYHKLAMAQAAQLGQAGEHAARSASASGSVSGSSSGGDVGRTASGGKQAGAAANDAGSFDGEDRGGPWQSQGPPCHAVLKVLPQVAAFVEAAAAAVAGDSSLQPSLAAVLVSLANMAPVAGLMQGRKVPLPILSCWVDAAQAAARLQPALARLQAIAPQLAQPTLLALGNQPLLQGLSGRLLQQVWAGIPIGIVPLGELPPEEAEQRASLASRVWQLHSASCRLVAYAAGGQPGGACPVLAWPQLDGRALWQLLDGLNSIFRRAHTLMCPMLDGEQLLLSPKAATQLRALCAAHLAAMQTLSDLAWTCGGFQGRDSQAMGQLLDVSARLAGVCPFLVDLSFFKPVFMTHSTDRGEVVLPLERTAQVAMEAVSNPRLMAAAVVAGLFKGVPQGAVWAVEHNYEGLGRLTVNKCLEALLGLAQAAEEAVFSLTARIEAGDDSSAPGDSSGSSTHAPADPEQQQAWAAVREQLQLGVAGIQLAHQVGQPKAAEGEQAPLEQRAKFLAELLRVAHPAATALLQFYELPEQAAEARLQAARAAAARSCAYLRCANVAGGGGPAAGTGAGSAKCSRCRSFWYCGTACSHADWRGPAGHRHVCKALGEERQQRREAGPQPQQPGAEVDWWERNAAATGMDVLILGNGFD